MALSRLMVWPLLMMKRFQIFLNILGWMLGGLTALGAGPGDEVVVIYNTRVPESKGVAEHYAEMRQVPKEQVLGFDLPDSESMSREEFRDQLQKPLWRFDVQMAPAFDPDVKHLERKLVASKVRYVALCYGVPLKIQEDSDL